MRTEIQFHETLQLNKSKNDQTVDKQYMKANIKCIKFQGRQHTQDSECYCLWDRLPCWIYIEPRWILETHPSIKQHIVAYVKTLILVDIHQQLAAFGHVPC
jgi:hypothetical protein